jgi:cysteinyl-tRNA synthetase
VLFELATAINRVADEAKLEAGGGDAEARAAFEEGAFLIRELGQILGLFHAAPQAAGGDDRLVGGLMQLLIDLRNEARKSKNFALGDQIRKRLGELGVTLEDRPGGTEWRVG